MGEERRKVSVLSKDSEVCDGKRHKIRFEKVTGFILYELLYDYMMCDQSKISNWRLAMSRYVRADLWFREAEYCWYTLTIFVNNTKKLILSNRNNFTNLFLFFFFNSSVVHFRKVWLFYSVVLLGDILLLLWYIYPLDITTLQMTQIRGRRLKENAVNPTNFSNQTATLNRNTSYLHIIDVGKSKHRWTVNNFYPK